ncbi:MAG: hypothetical protein ACYC6G_13485 [Desulfobaccales bacterium]
MGGEMMSPKGRKKWAVVFGLALLGMIILLPTLSISGDRLEIMGFYLGMSIDDAIKNINKLGIDNYKVMSSGVSFGENMGNWLQQDNNNKINYILFTYRLFDAQDLSLNDFVQKFSHSYHLSMKFDSMRDSYVNKTANCEILIPSDPMGIVIIQEIPQPEFNTNG